MAIIVILCGAPHLYKKDMNNSGLILICSVVTYKNVENLFDLFDERYMFSLITNDEFDTVVS